MVPSGAETLVEPFFSVCGQKCGQSMTIPKWRAKLVRGSGGFKQSRPLSKQSAGLFPGCLVNAVHQRSHMEFLCLIYARFWLFPLHNNYSLTLYENTVSVSSTPVCGILCGQKHLPAMGYCQSRRVLSCPNRTMRLKS